MEDSPINGPVKQNGRIDPLKAFDDPEAVTAAINKALRNARIAHKQQGVPMATWRDGKVVLVPPEQIEIDPPESSENSNSQ
jgi:hypothetical protein